MAGYACVGTIQGSTRRQAIFACAVNIAENLTIVEPNLMGT